MALRPTVQAPGLYGRRNLLGAIVVPGIRPRKDGSARAGHVRRGSGADLLAGLVGRQSEPPAPVAGPGACAAGTQRRGFCGASSRGGGSWRRARSVATGLGGAILRDMSLHAPWKIWFLVAAVLAAGVLNSAEAQPPPVFRSGVTLVTTDVIVRDGEGQFIPDLTRDDFTIHEDGVPQRLASLVMVHGGRVFNQLLPPPPGAGGNHPARTDPVGGPGDAGTDLRHLRRRPAHPAARHAADPPRDGPAARHADPRGGRVRHHLERQVSHPRADDERPEPAARHRPGGGRGVRPAATDRPGDAALLARRVAMARPRRLQDGARDGARAGADPASAQGLPVRERRLQLQSVRRQPRQRAHRVDAGGGVLRGCRSAGVRRAGPRSVRDGRRIRRGVQRLRAAQRAAAARRRGQPRQRLVLHHRRPRAHHHPGSRLRPADHRVERVHPQAAQRRCGRWRS